MGVLTDILRTARMECRVLSRHKMVRNGSLAARSTDCGYFYATTENAGSPPRDGPAVHEARSLAIWLAPRQHALTILDEDAEVVTGEIGFAGVLDDPLIEGLPLCCNSSAQSSPAFGFLFEQLPAKRPAGVQGGNGCAIIWPTCSLCRLCAVESSAGRADAAADYTG